MANIELHNHNKAIIRLLPPEEKRRSLVQILGEWGIGLGKIKSEETREATIIISQMIKVVDMQFQDFTLDEIETATLMAQADSLPGLRPAEVSGFTVPILSKILSIYRTSHKAKVAQNVEIVNDSATDVDYIAWYRQALTKYNKGAYKWAELELPYLANIYKNLMREYPTFLKEIHEGELFGVECKAYKDEYAFYKFGVDSESNKDQVRIAYLKGEFHDILKKEASIFRLPAYKLLYNFDNA